MRAALKHLVIPPPSGTSLLPNLTLVRNERSKAPKEEAILSIDYYYYSCFEQKRVE